MIQFGTGGWRAIIGDGFTKANVRLLIQGLCDRMAAEGVTGRGVVVGYDRRFLSQEAAQWACEVFAGNGVPVTFIGRPAPTPMFMWTVRNKQTPYGIAVTASHNPALYNGIKVFTEGGRDAEAEVTDALMAHISTLTDADVKSVRFDEAIASGAVTVQTSINWYLDAILDKLDVETIRHRHLHVVLDPMFGVAQTSLQTILMTARCQVDVINDRHDTLFGGRMPPARAHSSTCARPSWSARPTSASPPMATQTGSASSTTRAASCTPTRSWCCCTSTSSSARVGAARPCATCPPPTCSTASRTRTARSATRCPSASSGSAPRWPRRTP